MYKINFENNKPMTGQSVVKDSKTNNILNSFNNRIERMNKLTIEIKEKINKINSFREERVGNVGGQDPMEKSVDFLTDINTKIDILEIYNDRLQDIYEALDEII